MDLTVLYILGIRGTDVRCMQLQYITSTDHGSSHSCRSAPLQSTLLICILPDLTHMHSVQALREVPLGSNDNKQTSSLLPGVMRAGDEILSSSRRSGVLHATAISQLPFVEAWGQYSKVHTPLAQPALADAARFSKRLPRHSELHNVRQPRTGLGLHCA